MPKPTLDVLEKLLHYSTVRQKVISKNIANVNTEYYQREEVRFEDELDEAFKTPFKQTNERHIPLEKNSEEYEVIKDNDFSENNGVNNVDIQKEMVDMAENSILFRFGARKMSSYFQTLQDVIKGGGS